ncbi:MAG: acylphosphatase [Ferruginibacter sp.]
MATHYILVSGRVQGVFYRATAKRMANTIGISGWIKNKDDGKVEIMASGDIQSLKDFEDWCRLGSEGAHVTEIVVTPERDTAFFHFEIK